ncbi:MFS transporter [Rhodopila globiformis]|uniref:MFS transporter n=2 Tax=Rhodopila globiformis TaxID=1071 RepID=A0A2S6NGN4_RHOGL|nr:MFS transporter [Rhodopila globiformis]
MTRDEKKVIIASSLGTVFEWYDFYLYGSLAVVIGANFFGQFDEVTRNIFALLAFAAGFVVRPIGALVFGRLGDLAGRKYTFLVTILIMGSSTFLVGVIPTSNSIGMGAAVLLIGLRVLQGLALGGEYGGAATYVAEHAPQDRRGFYTSWIQTTATMGLFLSLLVILTTQSFLSDASFRAWGWRIPFLVSIVLLAISVWIRMRLGESPAFLRMKTEDKRSRAPLHDAFFQWEHAKWAILALFGLIAGQAVIWYCGQFYALFFLTSVLKVDAFTGNLLVAWALAAGVGGFILFGWLSDRIGRKPLILGGCLLAALTYFPAFKMIANLANPALAQAQQGVHVVLAADPAECSYQFNPTGLARYSSSCDRAKAALAGNSVVYSQEKAAPGTPASIRIGNKTIDPKAPGFAQDLAAALAAVGYPAAANPSVVRLAHPWDIFRPQPFKLVVVLAYLVILVTMVYGPVAAALVELFPTRIRYTSMSLPYHIGNGWFGGLLPAVMFAMNAWSGSIYFGLWYPVVVAAATAIVGLLLVPETNRRDIFEGDLSFHPQDRFVEFDPNAADY